MCRIEEIRNNFIEMCRVNSNSPSDRDKLKQILSAVKINKMSFADVIGKFKMVNGINSIEVKFDGEAMIIKVGNKPICFTCHYDTAGDAGIPMIEYSTTNGGHETWATAYVDAPPRDETKELNITQYHLKHDYVLGADDKAGMLVLLYMIEAGIEGTYYFFPDEESGAASSRNIADGLQNYAYNHAVAFDRKGYSDVITTQKGNRCCSDEFANALILRLKRYDLYMTQARGTFTDTANFVYTVPECTNISVGYFNQHGSTETQDLDFLARIIDFACDPISWEELPAVRELTEKPKPVTQYAQWDGQGFANMRYGSYDDYLRNQYLPEGQLYATPIVAEKKALQKSTSKLKKAIAGYNEYIIYEGTPEALYMHKMFPANSSSASTQGIRITKTLLKNLIAHANTQTIPNYMDIMDTLANIFALQYIDNISPLYVKIIK